jgi:hypothetical protein
LNSVRGEYPGVPLTDAWIGAAGLMGIAAKENFHRPVLFSKHHRNIYPVAHNLVGMDEGYRLLSAGRLSDAPRNVANALSVVRCPISATRRIWQPTNTAALCGKIQGLDQSESRLPTRVILRQKAVRAVFRRPKMVFGWERNDAGW